MSDPVQYFTQGTVRVRAADGTWSAARREAVSLVFRHTHPAAVTMIIDDVPWVFDRTLIEDAVRDMSQPSPIAGLGDVKVGREGMSQVRVWITSPTGEASVELPAKDVAAFVSVMSGTVPDGESLYDVDGWLSDLLGEGAEG